MGLTMRSGPVPFDQPIARVWNYYAEMMHCNLYTDNCFNCIFWVLVIFCFPSVTMCAYYARYGVEIKKFVLSCPLAISPQLFHSKLKTLLFSKSYPHSSSSPYLPSHLNSKHHPP